jgi:LuxR family transcriptional regulator, maltose regulon positive regulatory protein
MAATDLGVSLLRTKIHRPAVDDDHIHRPSLLARLDRHRHRPLTLISAPAGYGKSTLASCWLASADDPGAWVSLDENDNDPRFFLAYVVAAVHSIFPGILPKTQTLLNAPTLPPVSVLAPSLINELDAIDAAFILVLDDYHVIKDKVVHDLLSQILKHPPAPMHLVLTSRYEPPLSIASFRAHRQMTEIRARDLRFSLSDTIAYLKQALGTAEIEDIAIELEIKTEGWITGIHLAVLSLRQLCEADPCAPNLTGNNQQDAISPCLSQLPENNRFIMDYFIAEIFTRQPAHVRNMLLRTAILKQFDAELCEAMCAGSREGESPAMSGGEFISWLNRSNLFVIALDNEGRWFRYHHLFQQLLIRLLKKEFSEAAIAALHQKASAWLDRHERVSDAIDHALASGDVRAAAQVLERQRHTVLNNDNWPLLESWIARFPEDCQPSQPAILIAKAWLANFRGAIWAIPPILEGLDSLRQNEALDPSLEGEIEFFKAVVLFWNGRIGESLDRFQPALGSIDKNRTGAQNEMDIYFATASQMLGRGQSVIQKYQQAVYQQAKDGPRKARLIGCLVFVHLLSGDLAAALPWVRTLRDMGTHTQNQYVTAWGEYLLGYIHYQRNDLKTAVRHFSKAIEWRFFMDLNSPIDNYAGLALAYQAMQHPREANETIGHMMEFTQQSTSIDLTNLALAVKAEVMLSRGDPASAAQQFGGLHGSIDNSPMLFWIVEPRITRFRTLLAQASTEIQHKIDEHLDGLLQLAQATHNIPQTIAILNLQAMACKKLNDTRLAVTLLKQSLKLAQPGGWVRPFVVPGPEMRSLFDCLNRNEFNGSYVDAIITALDDEKTGLSGTVSTPQTPSSLASAEYNPAAPLTQREIDILDLLKGRLSNQEIADTLFISPETVKRHLYNIYKKLSVKNRREASAKITALNILP